MKNQFIKKGFALLLVLCIFTGCSVKEENGNIRKEEAAVDTKSEEIKYEVDPQTFTLGIFHKGILVPVSQAMGNLEVENVTESDKETKWSYPKEKVDVSVEPKNGYLRVSITSKSEEDNEFEWPQILGETYYMPFGEGKRIPAEDTAWMSYLKDQKFEVIEQLSMPFWATVQDDYAILFIMENQFRNTLNFSNSAPIGFTLNHRYPEIDKNKENSFRIYVTENNKASIAKIYKNYVVEKGDFVTLEEKAKDNPNIKKLYGAPHIYLAGENIISSEDINWQEFRKALNTEGMQYILTYASKSEESEEIAQIIKDISSQDYVDQYQKNAICRFLSGVLKEKDFYDSKIFRKQDDDMKSILEKEEKDESALIQLNKHALAVNFQGVFEPVDTWMNGSTVDLISDLKKSGMEQAWIGLNSWEQAYAKPELVKTAKKEGYLIGHYDSYHSIHKPSEEQWITAAFKDKTLYEKATVTNKDGKKALGFKEVGRKLNPTLSMPSVKQRTKEILSTGIGFNSWFIDCDATGEIYDDYSIEHITTQQQDLEARLERMKYIRDNDNMVIGSEGGNDFAASTIAFAHGIELKTFSWMDEDMKDKDSKYYIGKYYNPTGGVPEHFSKRIPVKEQLYTIFVDPKYDLPLFKLVYNDSVITSYHWDWSTFKIEGAVQDRMLREVLYNVPPLYHLDSTEWKKYKEDILSHTKVWSDFSKRVITKEMTDFQNVTEDGSVQMCEYGSDVSVIGNFKDTAYDYEGEKIPEHSILIKMDGKSEIYTPFLSPENK